MAHSIATTEFWSPRQLDDHQALSNHDSMLNGTGLTGFFIAGVSDFADTGVADTGEFFSVTDANVGATTDEPEWSSSTTPPQWLNQKATPSTLPVNVIGRTEEDAASNSTQKAVFVANGDYSAIYLSEIEHPTLSTSYTVPAGDWTARLYVTNANASIFIYKVVVMKVGFYGYSGNLVFGGPGTSVIYTHTESAPYTTLGAAGTYSVSFTTTSDTTIDPTAQSGGGAAEKLVVMFIVGNSATPTRPNGSSAIRFRHNRNILTPIPRVRTVSLDAASVSTAAQAVTIDTADITKSVGATSVATSAQGITIGLGGLTRTVNAVSVSAAAKPITISPGTATIVLGAVSASTAAQPITISPGAISKSLNTTSVAIAAQPVSISIDTTERTADASAFSVQTAKVVNPRVASSSIVRTTHTARAARVQTAQAAAIGRAARASGLYRSAQADAVVATQSSQAVRRRLAMASLGSAHVASSGVARTRIAAPRQVALAVSGGPRRTYIEAGIATPTP